MNLILAFSDIDKSRVQVDEDDIVLYNKRVSIPEDAQKININSNEPDLEVLTKDYLKILTNNQFKTSPELYELLKGALNNLYTNHLCLYKWITSIEKVLTEREVEKIIITDMIPGSGAIYAPYYEAEGEAHVDLFYKKYDFLPNIIFEYLKENHKLKLQVLKNRSKLLLRFRIFLRRYPLLIIKLLFLLFKKTTFNTRKPSGPDSHVKDIEYIYCTRSPAHLDALNKLISNTSSAVFCGEGLFTFGLNYESSTSSLKRPVYFFLDYISFFDIIRSFHTTIFKLMKVKRSLPIYSHHKGIKTCVSDSLVEIVISHFEVDVYEKALDNFLKIELGECLSESSFLFTAEMYTPYAFSAAKVARKYSLQSFQLQTTNMFVTIEPDYIYCDYFFYNSKMLADEFNKVSDKENAKYLGNFTSEKPPKVLLNTFSLQKVMYFTQPLTDEDIEKEIIQFLLGLKSEYGFELYIKLHPRDKIDKLTRFKTELDGIVHNESDFEDYMEDIDLAVLKTSSIASKIVLCGVPIIYCLFSEWARNGNLDYLDKSYLGSATNFKELKRGIENYEELVKDFKLYRDNYIKINDLENDVHKFIADFKSNYL